MRLALSLLATAAICAAWTIPFFGDKSSDAAPFLHPSSPVETDPRHARAKRQAYQVYVDGDTSVTVDKSGEAETGAWGPWQPEGQCSRSCGGGVQTEKRQCSGGCTGPSVRYVSCGLEKCSEGGDFRSSQCASHNDEAVEGKYYKWIPFRGKNKCELLCKPEGNGNFYFKWDEKVVDGTACDAKGTDICVDGVCLPVGCDGKLGSDKKADKCGKCDGKGDTCKTLEGTFDERNLSPGYHDIIKLPVGATAIKISELRDTSNNLALKNSTGDYVLNGNSMIQTETDVEVAGTVFEYEDSKKESLIAQGPLTEEVTVALLHRKGNKDSAIKYEFSIPVDEDVPFMYKPGDWTPCSVTCGKGVQTRTPFCVDTAKNSRVADEICDDNNSTKPETEKECLTVDCTAEWFTGDWESCSASCGSAGEQYRVVYCHQVFRDGKRITVDDGNCTSERPPVRQTCNRFSCPEWQAGPWSACSEKCGDAHQYRSVTCRSEKEGEEGKLLAAEQCESGDEMETQRACNLGPCDGLKFTTADWKLCTKCNETEETREVKCVDTQGRAYQLEKCLTNSTNEIPIDTRTCATQPPCLYEWTTSEWSKCSTECGHGSKTRRVVCAIHQQGDLEVVSESHCQGEKPEVKEECTNEANCTGTWFSGPWTDCSAECDGGQQSRVSVCLNYDHKPEPKWCDEKTKPADDQDCNIEACPTCFDSEFGCCPDNSTFATGDFFTGCSNCSLSEFGCCADNVTEATGANAQGCIEYVELEPVTKAEDIMAAEEGSGAEAQVESAVKEEMKECKLTSEDGTEASVDCGLMSGNGTDVEEGDLMGNETTIHCSKTEFGCCPDWYTPAAGAGNEGCESFVQGACNETQHGCCLDNVTLARGPNFEGCGEPSCAASLYGCCKDRKTIAFGPHYAGCERSSFPCELSPNGCCPDGETAALDKNGTGCGADCLTTKFGCCPDGVTVSKGKSNEGCGCVFAQFGCCPDGKSDAKGPGFFGCPSGCAQSQFGCCPDGKTSARGSSKEGCPCQYTRYGCCPDGETTSLGPKLEGCDDCRYAKHGCCQDGTTRALGPDYAGCPTTTMAPFMRGGTVAPSQITACGQPQDQGKQCAGTSYKLMWYYDTAEGRCSQFWYGGCEGNDNKFPTQELCENVCIEPPAKGRCYLPKVEGPQHCNSLEPRYYYDAETKICKAFWWRGCMGNSNNFPDWAACSSFCSDVDRADATTTTTTPAPAPVPTAAPFVPPQDPAFEIKNADDGSRGQAAPPHDPNAPRTMEDVCRLQPDAGPCNNDEEKFFYNTAAGKCERFRYGGCGGNLNSFPGESDCQMRCGFMADIDRPQPNQGQGNDQPIHAIVQPPHTDSFVFPPTHAPAPAPAPGPNTPSSKGREVCHQKVDVGRCQGSFSSFYYELATGTCVEFKYSGCGGNGNRFTTKAECEGLCVRSAAPEPAPGGVGPNGVQSPCFERKDTGRCPNEATTSYSTKWFYNQVDGVCGRFHYSGCNGTGNKFETEAECKSSCDHLVSACDKPIVVGLCSGKHVAFGFNKATGSCEKFEYSGCLGNNNRFPSMEECARSCPSRGGVSSSASVALSAPLAVPAPRAAAPSGPVNRCSLPKEIGQCRALIPSFYFDSAIGRCAAFNYGGCGGNANRFGKIEECQRECAPERSQALRMNPSAVAADQPRPDDRHEHWGRRASRPPRRLQIVERSEALRSNKIRKDLAPPPPAPITTTTTEEPKRLLPVGGSDEELLSPSSYVPSSNLPELCLLEVQPGSCYDKQLRWHYNDARGMCTSFQYTGCDANANNFESQESCERACGAFREERVCETRADAGECSIAVMKWHWDSGRRSCRQMVWGGCGGNGNRFSSKSECEQLCVRETAYPEGANVCMMATDAGPCNDAVTMWHYDMGAGACRQFTYGGCRGNGNRFLTRDACERQCAHSAASALPTPAALVQHHPALQQLQQDRSTPTPMSIPVETVSHAVITTTVMHLQPTPNATEERTVAHAHLPTISKVSLATASEEKRENNHTMQAFTSSVCSMAVNVGPCSAVIHSWYYDAPSDSCHPFAYGGCGGNQNRFTSEHECKSTCVRTHHSRSSIKMGVMKKTTLRTHEEGPFPTGAEIRLYCDSLESPPIIWYKDGALLEFTERVVEEDSFKTVVIHGAQPTDSGNYMCAVGADGIFSERVHVKVNALPVYESYCTDIGGRDTCQKILSRGLCGKKRYGTFCCRTCGSHGFEKFRF
ncbi:hypothetical protein PENTCL1PPCAC_1643 [Pristionchus entomophagus]|uniref:Uncharacterized protein n=1 Tax=Pristionchus entomophagus TaxID=358040 RepID=A0AAV5SFL2_9BILA|nr:hypothetical protein PENTCL1PPCAC_1643 [Pristionchus entomophagus]